MMCLCLCYSQAFNFGVTKWPLLPDALISVQKCMCIVLIFSNILILYHVRLCDVVLLCFTANSSSYTVGHLKAYICIKFSQQINPSSSACSASLQEALKVAQCSHSKERWFKNSFQFTLGMTRIGIWGLFTYIFRNGLPEKGCRIGCNISSS